MTTEEKLDAYLRLPGRSEEEIAAAKRRFEAFVSWALSGSNNPKARALAIQSRDR